MQAFFQTFGTWFGALLAIFLFVVALTLFVLWVLSHNAPKESAQ